MSRALPTGLARYRDVVLGRPRGVSALPQPYDVPRIVATAFKGVQIAQELSRFWLWGLPAAAAGLWMTYPAMSEPTRRMLVPGYALLYPEEKPAEDAVPKKK